MADDQEQTQDDAGDNLNMSHDQLMELLNHVAEQRNLPVASPYQSAQQQPPAQPKPQTAPIPANVPQTGKVLDQASGAWIRPDTAESVAKFRQQGDQLNQQDQDAAKQQAGQPQNQWQQIYNQLRKQNPQASPQQLLMSMKAYKDAGAFDIYAKNAIGKTVEEQLYAAAIKEGKTPEEAAKFVQENRGIGAEASGAKEDAKNKSDIGAAASKASEEVVGKARGTAEVDYAKIQAGMPSIQKAVKSLSVLAATANYNIPQEVLASARREIGLPVGQGAIDAAQYESVLNNVLLPRLRSIFGARVTNFDVQAAAKMLGNPKLSPPEKQAQLESFIQQSLENVETDKQNVKNLGGTPSTQDEGSDSAPQAKVINYSDWK